jgi:hypothetical protein
MGLPSRELPRTTWPRKHRGRQCFSDGEKSRACLVLRIRKRCPLAGSMLSLLRWWLDRGAKESPRAMDELFHRMIWNGLQIVAIMRPACICWLAAMLRAYGSNATRRSPVQPDRASPALEPGTLSANPCFPRRLDTLCLSPRWSDIDPSILAIEVGKGLKMRKQPKSVVAELMRSALVTHRA